MKPVATTDSKPAKPGLFAAIAPRIAISERRLLLITMDTLIIILSLLGSLVAWEQAGSLRVDLARLQSQSYWLFPLAVGWLLWLALSDTYNLRLAVRFGSVFWRILVGGLVISFIYLVVFFITSRAAVTEGLPLMLSSLSNGTEPLRFAPAVAVLTSTSLLIAWRFAYISLLCGPATRIRLLIVGAGQAGRTIAHLIGKHYRAHYTVVGFIDDDPAKQNRLIGGVPVLGQHPDLDTIAYHYGADEVVLAISSSLPSEMLQALMTCHERGLVVSPMPVVYERLTGRVAVEHIGTQWYVALPLQPRAAATALLVTKRLIDILGGLVLGLLLLLCGPIIALLIKLDSAGSIFYRQERLGQHGRPFAVIKFRSMESDAERDGARWSQQGDPRITRVGAFLRRTRLDELPQAINVLRGEMSLVGPRPERPEFIAQLQEQIPFYRTRLAAKPGLTGWAQINYGYGSTTEDALIKLQYDLYYLKHQSPWFDLLIMARTVAVVLRMQGR
ncbi:MAG: TIGR03013 family PEP-CTERM/XrtA system glycosyltransferase [Roseiflexaceae bacterium]